VREITCELQEANEPPRPVEIANRVARRFRFKF
jgi:hypothetical protein